MSIRKILIAVDEQPLSVRAAELGAELARALGGEVAPIHVNAQGYPGDTGIPPQQLIAQAQDESKRLLAGFRERTSVLRAIPCAKSSKNSKANRIETGETSGGIRRNLFGGSRRKIAKK